MLDNPLITGEIIAETSPEELRARWRAEWDARVKTHWDHNLRPTHKVPDTDDWQTNCRRFRLLKITRGSKSCWLVTTPNTYPFGGQLHDSQMDALDAIVEALS